MDRDDTAGDVGPTVDARHERADAANVVRA
jgi:hypothetical protein